MHLSMDFVCKVDNGEYVMVEMQVMPQKFWDKRTVSYVTVFYGNHLRKDKDWKDITKVIVMNIVGGGERREISGQYV